MELYISLDDLIRPIFTTPLSSNPVMVNRFKLIEYYPRDEGCWCVTAPYSDGIG